MMRFTALSAAALALAVAAPLGTEAEATPISDQMAADMYKQCYDYCLGGESEDFCRSSCTCSVRLTEKQITVEEATALGNGTASPEVQARLAAITRQCSN
jgi:predicted outer membrane protein